MEANRELVQELGVVTLVHPRGRRPGENVDVSRTASAWSEDRVGVTCRRVDVTAPATRGAMVVASRGGHLSYSDAAWTVCAGQRDQSLHPSPSCALATASRLFARAARGRARERLCALGAA